MPQLIISHHRCSSSSAPALLLGGRWGRWARLGDCGVGARHPAPNSPAPTCRLDAHAVDARAGLDVPSPALLAGVLLPTQLTNPCPWLQAAAVSAPLRSSRRATSSRGRSLGAVRGRREHPRVDALARDALRGAHQRPVPDSPARLVASAARRSRQTHPTRLARRHGWARCPLARAACRRPAPDSPVLTPIALISHLARCYPGPPRFADSTNTNPIVRPSGCASRADVPRSSSLASAICHSSTRATGISFSFLQVE
jgi:hypothetical protein